MKKPFSVVIVFFIIIMVSLPTQIFAANELTFAIGSVGTVTRGESIRVPITVSNNPGFAAVGLAVTYDPNVLEITNVTDTFAAMPLNSFNLTSTPGSQWILLVNTTPADWSDDGIVANITFKVKSNATLGTSPINLSFTNSPDGTPANASAIKIADAEVVSRNINVINASSGGSGGSNWYSGSGSSSTPTPTPSPTETPSTLTPEPPSSTEETAPPAPYDNSNDAFNSNDTSEDDAIVDDGGFLGTAYDDTVSEADDKPASKPAGAKSFGIVPQTGVPSMTGPIIGLCISFAASIALYVSVVLRLNYKRKYNGGE